MVPILLFVFKNMERVQNIPASFSEGVITIFYKNKGDKNNLDNYRPISLLNTDYKILTKTLANRVKTVVDSIIDHTQAYSIAYRIGTL